MSSLFCRHNRFTADCPICSKGTVLDAERAAERRPRPATRSSAGARRRGRTADAPPAQFSGPYVSAGPYEREDGTSYEVRLERVPGGVRIASWAHGRLERRAPELPAGDLVALVAGAGERRLLPEHDLDALAAALPEASDGAPPSEPGVSPGRAGDMREELRVERLPEGTLRIARWLLFPSRGWELQDAPPMLPAARYAEALRSLFGATRGAA